MQSFSENLNLVVLFAFVVLIVMVVISEVVEKIKDRRKDRPAPRETEEGDPPD
ncbi:MAG: hypothetical protein O2923_10185 [Verrucomicrobia bacterium]|nr:hypothetical protein [Verrucomicrobiota bacterium]MDA1086325.1 hypothetical protein [Verrucomicrobiota bacterium]